jgi:recombinational DNA repair protein RecT
MIQEMGEALIDLQVKYRSSSLTDRMAMKPALEELLADYANLQVRLIKEGVITTDEELEEMADIKQEIEEAAEKEALLKAMARTIAFIATKV